MKRSTFLFYLIALPGFSFVVYFFSHALALFPILFAFLKHVCYGWESFVHIAPIVMAQTFAVLMLFFASIALLANKMLSLCITAWKVRHLKRCRNIQKYTQFVSLQTRYSKLILFISRKPIAFCHVNTIYLSSGLFHILEEREVEAVFLHELRHAQSLDSARTWILELLNNCILFPFLASLIHEFKLSLEVEADGFVQSTQGSDRFLKGALLKVITYPALEVAHFSACQLEDRIHAIKKKHRSITQTTISIWIGMILFFLFSITFLHHAKMALAMSESSIHHDANFCVNDNLKVIPMSSIQNYSSASH